MTSLKETERFWRAGARIKAFLRGFEGKDEVDGLDGGMKEYWNGAWSRLGESGASHRD